MCALSFISPFERVFIERTNIIFSRLCAEYCAPDLNCSLFSGSHHCPSLVESSVLSCLQHYSRSLFLITYCVLVCAIIIKSMVNGGTEQRKLLFFHLPKTFTMFPVRHSFADTHRHRYRHTSQEKSKRKRSSNEETICK